MFKKKENKQTQVTGEGQTLWLIGQISPHLESLPG